MENQNTISIKDARKILGAGQEKYTDAQLEVILNSLTLVADLAINDYLLRKQIVKTNQNSPGKQLENK